ncbi:hypothetical protein G7Y89_g9623 [Cudoniella acicularis]|uniref:RBR-type E3 ubiquitin transferase n=1 Tax=Cudoniella acicularis TaxID=354080 RepID=A0A8H4RGI9_9HELO|nr:hypothetical protein G7Y89_g9623 [Cudoniella acicularis]
MEFGNQYQGISDHQVALRLQAEENLRAEEETRNLARSQHLSRRWAQDDGNIVSIRDGFLRSIVDQEKINREAERRLKAVQDSRSTGESHRRQSEQIFQPISSPQELRTTGQRQIQLQQQSRQNNRLFQPAAAATMEWEPTSASDTRIRDERRMLMMIEAERRARIDRERERAGAVERERQRALREQNLQKWREQQESVRRLSQPKASFPVPQNRQNPYRPQNPQSPPIQPSNQKYSNQFSPTRQIHRKAPLAETVNCVACMEPGPKDKSILLDCKHEFCRVCLYSAFKSAFSSRTLFKCCGIQVPIINLSRNPSNPFLESYNTLVMELSTKNPVYCASVFCGKFIPSSNIQGRTATCPVATCRQRTCVACKKMRHKGVCADDKESIQVQEMGKKLGWKNCPKCSHLVERIEGCLHMTYPSVYKFQNNFAFF